MARTELEKLGKLGDDASYVDLDAQSKPGAQTGDIRNGDASMTSTREDRFLRPPLAVALVGVSLGFLFLASGLNRPSISSMRTIGIVNLLATGGGCGAGLVGLVASFVGRCTG
jgi:hypothetical protein